jgi:hypothetical protein
VEEPTTEEPESMTPFEKRHMPYVAGLGVLALILIAALSYWLT